MLRNYIFLMISLFSTSVFSCSSTDRLALEQLALNIQAILAPEKIQGDIDFGVVPSSCKILPSKNGKTVLVKPYGYTKKNGASEESYLGIAIAIADSKTGSIESLINEARIVTIDAIAPKSISIDTARYKIAPKTIAFGIRIFQKNQSNVNPFQEEFMNLYTQKGQAIEKVVSGLVTSTYSGEGDGACEFKGAEEKTTVAISPKMENGRNKLIAIIKTKQISTYKKDGECIEDDKHIDSKKFTIQYNGNQYEIPEELKTIQARY